MIAFRIISIAAGLGLAIFLTYRRFKVTRSLKNEPFFPRLASYFRWLGRAFSRLLKREGWLEARSFYLGWLSLYPQLWQRWTLTGVILSFIYLAASGFGFALLSRRGLFGLTLLFHVTLGGIFVLGLAALTVLRAKHYTLFFSPEGSASSLSSSTRNIPQPLLRPLLFWLFILSGLSLGLTALLSMLPYFAFEAQVDIIGVHRYSGLVALLSAMLLLDQAISRQKS
ncbi:MAG: hypothetical protein QHH14_03845 [Clostridiales bacterium]|nr:hypothetical protein [Clostridiales bacterium]